jgi:hypothetical protein
VITGSMGNSFARSGQISRVGRFLPLYFSHCSRCAEYQSVTVEQAQLPVPARSYMQVLNLFYLCQPNFKQAIAAMAHKPAAIVCPSEAGYFPWLWYVWGGPAVALDSYKERYQTIRSGCHFYFDKNNGRIVAERATKQVFARHTQGLKHDLLVPFFAGLIGPD